MPEEGSTTKVRQFGFLLVADFSLIAFSSAFDALRMANRMREQNRGNLDPDVASIEMLRKRDGGQMNLDNSFVQGGPTYSVPSEQY